MLSAVPMHRFNQYSDLDISGGTNILDSKVATRPDYAGTYSHTSLQPVASYLVRRQLQQQVEDRLHEARAGRRIHTSIVVLVSLGGAGKSQLTLIYIQTHQTEYNAVFWVDARLRESLERDYVQIDRLLSGHEQGVTSDRLDIDRIITAVKTWFEVQPGRRERHLLHRLATLPTGCVQR
ncbi:hypothetical protein LTR74_018346 [Friedmanniomyces endolithicus]|nr:hypothetical protein LTR74_018346 [Friedmanniomyces endolithicus]